MPRPLGGSIGPSVTFVTIEDGEMIDKLKQEAMRRGMMMLTNPKVMKMMADPRVMNAISQGFAFRGQVQSGIENTIRNVATSLNLATREDVDSLRRTLSQIESSVSSLERKADQ
jgi:polyhydroxyalkanoate synthesis regulator phasin